MNTPVQRTKYQYLSPFQCKKDCDTVVIASLVTRLDYYFYGPPDNGERYFSKIAFWFRKGEIRSGTHVYLDGSRASLCDNYRVAYEILSASIVFDEAFSIGYNSGAFTVTYKTLKGGTAQLTGGRFKLIRRTESVESAKAFFALDPKGVK